MRRHGERQRRSYRDVQADGRAELERAARNPIPDGLPDRPAGEREARQRALEAPWARIRDRLREQLGDFTMYAWIDPLEPYDATTTTLYLAAPDTARSFTGARYGEILAAAATEEAGKPIDVAVFTPESAPGPAAGQTRERARA